MRDEFGEWDCGDTGEPKSDVDVPLFDNGDLDRFAPGVVPVRMSIEVLMGLGRFLGLVEVCSFSSWSPSRPVSSISA